MACPTICTTNDMPVVFPPSFNALDQIPFQINPHFTNATPENHHGETREQRITEYLYANKDVTVVGLREGCTIKVENGKFEHIGEHPMRIFQFGKEYYEVNSGDDLSFLQG
jgi:dipeptidase E